MAAALPRTLAAYGLRPTWTESHLTPETYRRMRSTHSWERNLCASADDGAKKTTLPPSPFSPIGTGFFVSLALRAVATSSGRTQRVRGRRSRDLLCRSNSRLDRNRRARSESGSCQLTSMRRPSGSCADVDAWVSIDWPRRRSSWSLSQKRLTDGACSETFWGFDSRVRTAGFAPSWTEAPDDKVSVAARGMELPDGIRASSARMRFCSERGSA